MATAVALITVFALNLKPQELSSGPASSTFIAAQKTGSDLTQQIQEQLNIDTDEFTGEFIEIDDLQSANLASAISQESNMPVASNITEYRDTLIIQKTVAPIQLDIVDKPQTTILSGSAREIKDYTVQAGETVDSIADQFSISTQTIRWANDISESAEPEVGKVLKILPVSGVLVTAKKGDRVKAIAEQTEASAEEIAIYNELDLEAEVPEGLVLIIPNGTPRKEPVVVQRTTTSTSTPRFIFSPGNTYARGYCTWWAQNRRIQIGRPVPNRMGNAISWARAASAAGYAVDGNPQPGDVIWHRYASSSAGHVAFVEAVNPDGSLRVSDMNNPYWGRVTYRTVPVSEFGRYLFIH